MSSTESGQRVPTFASLSSFLTGRRQASDRHPEQRTRVQTSETTAAEAETTEEEGGHGWKGVIMKNE